MKVLNTVVNDVQRRTLEWPDGFPIPHPGDHVMAPWGDWLTVRTVNWYPFGTPITGETEPFAYLVLVQPPPIRDRALPPREGEPL